MRLKALPFNAFEDEGQQSYRDELNFAEFPLALLDRPKEGQKTLEFADTIFDQGRKTEVKRKLTIAASDKYGLPTPRDEEVILGLIQLSHQKKFATRRVHFSKGQLVKLLGWSDDGKSYHRITEALNKWASVTLFWEKSWWSKEEQCWVDETFHVLDNVTLYDRERLARSVSSADEEEKYKSSFVWNEVVYRSFKAGYLKALNLEFFKSLQSPVAKKMYRFLDKRFYHSKKLEFPLTTFAFEHIGLSRSYHTGELKRRFKAAIKELEIKGFLEPMAPRERFRKIAKGRWVIGFTKKSALKSVPKESSSAHEQALRERGVSERVASELTQRYPKEFIQGKIEAFDTLQKSNDQRTLKNPAGFLVASIRDDFTAPKEAPKRSAMGALPPYSPAPLTEEPLSKEELSKRAAFSAWWESLSQERQCEVEKAALEVTDPFSRRQYLAGKSSKGQLFKAFQTKILQSYFLSRVWGNEGVCPRVG